MGLDPSLRAGMTHVGILVKRGVLLLKIVFKFEIEK
jgi:hypothetical protein